MQRAILFMGYDIPIEQEIREYIRDEASETYFVQTPIQAIRILDDHPVDCVVLNFSSLSDAAILRYISQYHPGIKMVLSASKEFDEIISIFNQSKYSRLPRPFRLEELKSII